MRLFTFLLFLFAVVSHTVSSQSVDSVKVFFIGHEPIGERFIVTLDGKEVIRFRTNGAYKKSFNIPRGEEDEGVGLNIFRKGRFGLKKRFIEMNIHYVNDFQYLILIRDQTLKNKYAVRHEWTSKEPYVHHLDEATNK